MAIPWLLSLVFLLAPLAVAQGYSDGNDLLDVTITKSVTETVTKYLSQCGISPTPFEASETTILSGTTTVTSTLESTISVVITPNVTDVSGVLPTGFTTSEFALNSTHPGLSRSLTHSHPSGFNYSTPLANVTTTLPCSTATVSPPLLTSSKTHTLSSTPIRGTSSTAATTVAPSQIPVSGSTTLQDGVAIFSLSGLLGTLGVALMLVAGFL